MVIEYASCAFSDGTNVCIAKSKLTMQGTWEIGQEVEAKFTSGAHVGVIQRIGGR